MYDEEKIPETVEGLKMYISLAKKELSKHGSNVIKLEGRINFCKKK